MGLTQNTESEHNMNTMIKRSKGLSKAEAADTLESMAVCRKAMSSLLSRVAIKSMQYRQAGAVISDLDELAYLITGNPTYFQEEPPSTHRKSSDNNK